MPIVKIIATVAVVIGGLFIVWVIGDQRDGADVENSSQALDQNSTLDSIANSSEISEMPTTEKGTDLGGLSVEFGDGDAIAISYNQPPKYPDIPAGSVSEFYEEWSWRARAGDGDAAFLLHNSLAGCKSRIESEEELNETIDQLYQTHSIHTSGDGIPSIIPGSQYERLEIVEASLRESFVKCKELNDEQIANGNEWLTLAANNGNSHAARQLAQEYFVSDLGESIKYLEMAWLSGDLDALSELAFIHSKGRRGRPDETDPVQANAYWSLYVMITQQLQEAGGELMYVPPSEEITASYASQLRPHEVEQSIALAKQILRSNPNCCFSRLIR